MCDRILFTTMATNRDEILSNFQACTGIEDFDLCLAHLEQNEWCLERAVNSVIEAQQEAQHDMSNSVAAVPMEPPPSSFRPAFADLGDGESACIPQAVIQNPVYQPSVTPPRPPTPPATRPQRMIRFAIEYRDKNINLVLEDSRTVDTIKSLLSAELNIPAEKMLLGGWGHGRSHPNDTDLLSSLHLPLDNRLYLQTPSLPETSGSSGSNSNQSNGEEISFADKLMRCFELCIMDTDDKQEYKLRYAGSKTILDVKQGIYALTQVPVRHQQWDGWPVYSEDTLTLAASGIVFPKHELLFRRINNKARPAKVDDQIASSEDEEFEDASDMYLDDSAVFSNDHASRRFESLLPNDVEDETLALMHFSHEFGQRYGETHPQFYLAPLENAIKEAFNVSAKDRKLLAIYIHNDKSVQSNVFCSQLLCAESVVSFLTQNFIIWGWDVSSEQNKTRLLTTCTKLFGSVTTATIKNLQQDKFPLLLIVMRIRSNTEVFSVLQGNTSLDELMTSLIHAVESYNSQRQSEVVQEEERNAAESLKKEQDEAYQVSLLADRAKLEERLRLEREEVERQEEAARETRQREVAQEARRMSYQSQLAIEPPEDSTEPISTVRMRLPTGEMLTRRFIATNPIRMVITYLGTKGYHTDEYKILTTFPKKDLTTLDESQTFKELNLFPQETLFVEER